MPIDNDQALDVCEALTRASSLVARVVEGAVSDVYGMGYTDLMLMRRLSEAEAPPRRVDLAERMGLTASGVTRALIPLEKVGLVERIPDPRDARASRASLTPAGRERLTDASAAASERARRLLTDRLEKSEISELGRILAKLSSD